MRDEEKKSFARIANGKSVGYETVVRAYDHARPNAVRKAAENGEAPKRGGYSLLGAEKYDRWCLIRNATRERPARASKFNEIQRKVFVLHDMRP
jgi:hypothetical protein